MIFPSHLAVNCGAFPPIIVYQNGKRVGQTTTVCGDSSGGMKKAPLPMVMTHAGRITNHDEERRKERRKESCDTKGEYDIPELELYCGYDNEILYEYLRRPASRSVQLLECDEFPWAASEEGGNYLPKSQSSRHCIPRVQNNHAGQCVGK